MFNNLFTLVPDIGKAAETLGVFPTSATFSIGRPGGKC